MGSAILTRLDRVLFERIRLWVPLVYLNPCAYLNSRRGYGWYYKFDAAQDLGPNYDATF